MVIVQNIGKKLILAKDENGQWYKVTDKSVSVGDVVSSDKCIKLSERHNRVYNKREKILKVIESMPNVY